LNHGLRLPARARIPNVALTSASVFLDRARTSTAWLNYRDVVRHTALSQVCRFLPVTDQQGQLFPLVMLTAFELGGKIAQEIGGTHARRTAHGVDAWNLDGRPSPGSAASRHQRAGNPSELYGLVGKTEGTRVRMEPNRRPAAILTPSCAGRARPDGASDCGLKTVELRPSRECGAK